jgi:agmatinase
MMHGSFSLAALVGFASARDIIFPPVAAIQQPLAGFEADVTGGAALDISGARFLGLTTYANLPYVHCLAAEDEHVEVYDIAFLGAPFDTVGSPFTP